MDDLRGMLAEFDEGLEMISHAQDHSTAAAVKLLAAIMKKLLDSLNTRVEKQRMEIAVLRARLDKAKQYMASEPWNTPQKSRIADAKLSENGHK